MFRMNSLIITRMHNFKLEPGDATAYRFGFHHIPLDNIVSYTMSDGVGSGKNFILAYIYMPGGCGYGCINTGDLILLQKEPGHAEALFNYLHSYGHGFDSVNVYTLMAVLLALGVLVQDIHAEEEACTAMLEAPKYLAMMG